MQDIVLSEQLFQIKSVGKDIASRCPGGDLGDIEIPVIQVTIVQVPEVWEEVKKRAGGLQVVLNSTKNLLRKKRQS